MDDPEVDADPSRAAQRQDRRLWADLLRRARRDQELRRRLSAAPAADDPDLSAELTAMGADNSDWLAAVVARSGWPGRSRVGEDGAMAAWLLAQHAEPQVQRRLLTALQEAVAAGEATPAQAAYLEDRVRVGQGLPQRYGTQFHQQAGGRAEPAEIEDPEQLDARRAAMGLGPFAAHRARPGPAASRRG
ncbi:MAG TPA: DUF6624 domain-containing protein [Kineosporiaceae bacterium]|nr:DUF6624 domain-containing protein [Kineosporiaceae bacterium]